MGGFHGVPRLYDSREKQASWHTAKTRSSTRRLNIVLVLVLGFVFWRTLCLLFKADESDEEVVQGQVFSTIRSRQYPPSRYYKSLEQYQGRPNVAQNPLVTIERDSIDDTFLQVETERRDSYVEPGTAPKQSSSGNAKSGNSANNTPEEEDDGEEDGLKRLAVAPKDKELPSAAQVLQTHAQSLGKNEIQMPKTVKDPSEPKAFPPYSEYASQDDRADNLPDVIHMPFEDTVADVVLSGWEEEWFSDAKYDAQKWGNLSEPKIDFVYTWVNGSDVTFQDTIYPYELNSSLNDPEGQWLESHRVNRYRDWDELRYSIRTVEKFAKSFRNKIQILVNAVGAKGVAKTATMDNPAQIMGRQTPLWMKTDATTKEQVEVLTQEDFFDESEIGCLPTFNSLTIENQIYNTKSTTDRFFALSDDMLLGKPHAASDLYSPLFGPTMGFKTNGYNTRDPPTDLDARRFGEKPYLIFTSWLLNRRFGERKRKGQVHFGHSLSRSVMREAIQSFPRPALQSTCQRFRGETGFQLYSWYVAFHYTIERHREALLWSYIMQRSDTNQDGNLNWVERQVILAELEEGMSREGNTTYRSRQYYQINELLENAGLESPKVNLDTLWTSLDGPVTMRDIECFEFNVNECVAPGFSTHSSDELHVNPVFSAASIFDRVARQHPKCGDCMLKLILNRAEQGLGPLLPHMDTQSEARQMVIKALTKYQYTLVEPDALFVMVTDAQQVKNVLLKRLIKDKRQVGQLCLNDDVATEEPFAINALRKNMIKLLNGIVPEPSQFEATVDAIVEEFPSLDAT